MNRNCLPEILELLLSRKGHRITNARKDLLNFIVEKRDVFFTIDDYKKKFGNANISTFYNNIQLLIDGNIVDKISDLEETKYYINYRSILIQSCLNCKKVVINSMDKNLEFKIKNIVNTKCIVTVSKCDYCSV